MEIIIFGKHWKRLSLNVLLALSSKHGLIPIGALGVMSILTNLPLFDRVYSIRALRETEWFLVVFINMVTQGSRTMTGHWAWYWSRITCNGHHWPLGDDDEDLVFVPLTHRLGAEHSVYRGYLPTHLLLAGPSLCQYYFRLFFVHVNYAVKTS